METQLSTIPFLSVQMQFGPEKSTFDSIEYNSTRVTENCAFFCVPVKIRMAICILVKQSQKMPQPLLDLRSRYFANTLQNIQNVLLLS